MPIKYQLKVKEEEFNLNVENANFNGPDYEPEYDLYRLTGQILRIFNCMKDGKWRTFDEIKIITGDPQASISAQLRHLRKERFGEHTIEKRSRGNRLVGLFEYKLIINKKKEIWEW